MKIIVPLFLLFLTITTSYSIAESLGQSTGYKLPRFVSTKSDESNLRKGANTDYPILLTYKVKNLPLEVIGEHDKWRKVKDFDGNEGWMHKDLLKGNRFGLINTSHGQFSQILIKPKGKLIGNIGNRNIVKLNKCLKKWCHISINKNKGWINKKNLWGVYEKEEVNIPFHQPIINLIWKLNLY